MTIYDILVVACIVITIYTIIRSWRLYKDNIELYSIVKKQKKLLNELLEKDIKEKLNR